MFAIYSLVPLLQVLMAAHAIKTGRNWYWVWIIMGFPVVGAMVYFFVEVMPEANGANFTLNFDSLLNLILPGRELKTLEAQVELTHTVENKMALASYYVRKNQPEKAIEIYQSCLQGSFQDNGDLLLDLSVAQYNAGRFHDAVATLQRLNDKKPAYEQIRRELLYARAIDGTGQTAEAKVLFEKIAEKYGGEEASCCLASILEKLGEKDRARAIYQEVVKRTKNLPYHHRKLQMEWIGMAKSGLKRLATT